MEQNDRAASAGTTIILIVLCVLSVTGCVKTKEPQYTEPYASISAINNMSSNDSLLLTNTTINVPATTKDKGKTVIVYAWKAIDNIVKKILGDNAWYYIVAALLIVVVLAILKSIGQGIFWGLIFIILIYFIMKVNGT